VGQWPRGTPAALGQGVAPETHERVDLQFGPRSIAVPRTGPVVDGSRKLSLDRIEAQTNSVANGKAPARAQVTYIPTPSVPPMSVFPTTPAGPVTVKMGPSPNGDPRETKDDEKPERRPK